MPLKKRKMEKKPERQLFFIPTFELPNANFLLGLQKNLVPFLATFLSERKLKLGGPPIGDKCWIPLTNIWLTPSHNSTFSDSLLYRIGVNDVATRS